MRGYDVFIVRMLPFILFIEMGIHSFCSLCGYYFEDYLYLHNNSVIYATALFFISLANRHYHCKWNRAMYLFLIIVPIFNYIDAKFAIVPDTKTYLWIYNIAYGLTAITTSFMAIKHFLPTLKRR